MRKMWKRELFVQTGFQMSVLWRSEWIEKGAGSVMTEQEIKKNIHICKNCGSEYYSVKEEFKCTKCGYVNRKESEADEKTDNKTLQKL